MMISMSLELIGNFNILTTQIWNRLVIHKAMIYTVVMPFKKGYKPWNKGKKSKYDFNQYRRVYLSRHPWVRNWTASKIRAKRLGREHSLKSSDFKILWFRDKAYELKSPSIDRIDNKKGYVAGNCRFIELSENTRNGRLGVKLTKKQKDLAIKNLHWYKK